MGTNDALRLEETAEGQFIVDEAMSLAVGIDDPHPPGPQMKISHVLFKSQTRTRANESMTTALDVAYGEIESFVDPTLGPMVRYEGSPWAIPMENIACIAAATDARAPERELDP